MEIITKHSLEKKSLVQKKINKTALMFLVLFSLGQNDEINAFEITQQKKGTSVIVQPYPIFLSTQYSEPTYINKKKDIYLQSQKLEKQIKEAEGAKKDALLKKKEDLYKKITPKQRFLLIRISLYDDLLALRGQIWEEKNPDKKKQLQLEAAAISRQIELLKE